MVSPFWHNAQDLLPRYYSPRYAHRDMIDLFNKAASNKYRIWCHIGSGQFKGTIGELRFPKNSVIDSFYELGSSGSGRIKKQSLFVVTKTGKTRIETSGSLDSIWGNSKIAITENHEEISTILVKAPPKSKTPVNVPIIRDHFGDEISVGSTVALVRSQRMVFGKVTKILETGSFRWSEIKTRPRGERYVESKDSCYTMDLRDVVIVDNSLLDKVLIGRLTS